MRAEPGTRCPSTAHDKQSLNAIHFVRFDDAIRIAKTNAMSLPLRRERGVRRRVPGRWISQWDPSRGVGEAA